MAVSARDTRLLNDLKKLERSGLCEAITTSSEGRFTVWEVFNVSNLVSMQYHDIFMGAVVIV